MNTSCKKCVFQKNKNKCSLDLIEKYKQKGFLVEQDADGYSIIKEKVCRSLRVDPWGHDYVDKKSRVRLENKLTFRAVILVNKNINIKQIFNCIENLKTQTHPFLGYSIYIDPNSNIDLVTLITELEKQNIVFKIENLISLSFDPDTLTSLKNFVEQYYVLIDPNKTLPVKFNESLDCIVNDELNHFVMVRPAQNNNEHGRVVQTIFHNYSSKWWLSVLPDNINNSIYSRIEALCEKYKENSKSSLILGTHKDAM